MSIPVREPPNTILDRESEDESAWKLNSAISLPLHANPDEWSWTSHLGCPEPQFPEIIIKSDAKYLLYSLCMIRETVYFLWCLIMSLALPYERQGKYSHFIDSKQKLRKVRDFFTVTELVRGMRSKSSDSKSNSLSTTLFCAQMKQFL